MKAIGERCVVQRVGLYYTRLAAPPASAEVTGANDNGVTHIRDPAPENRTSIIDSNRQTAQVDLIQAEQQGYRRNQTANNGDSAYNAGDSQNRRGIERRGVEHLVLRSRTALLLTDPIQHKREDIEADQREDTAQQAGDHADNTAEYPEHGADNTNQHGRGD